MDQSPSLLRRLGRVPEFLDHPSLTVIILLISALTLGVFPVMEAHGTKTAVDAMGARDIPALIRGVTVLAAVAIAGSVHGFLSGKYRLDSLQVFAARQRERLLDSAIRLPLESYERMPRGDLVSRMNADVAQASYMVTYLYRLARMGTQAVSAAVYMVMLNRRVGLVVAAVGFLTPVVTGFWSRSGGEKSTEFHKAIGDASSSALNTLEGVQVIKAYCAEEQASGWFATTAERVFQSGMRYGKWIAGVQAWSNGGIFFPYVAAFAYGGYLGRTETLSLGTVLALLRLCLTLSGPVADMSNQWAFAARSLGAFGRVLEIVDLQSESDPVADGEQAGTDAKDSIIVRSLSFSYGEGIPVLSDVSFEVPEGQLAVIVGKSGCGKSTLLKLVSGLYRPPPGTVFVDGFDVHFSAISEARRRIAYIPQEPYLLAGTVRDNLELGKEQAGDEEYRKVLRLADALDFVDGMPEGMDGEVGERGGNLSGGQRQRLCVARTVLRDADILLMDEPTSSVDRESEERIWEGLLGIMSGRTTLLVTHRLAVSEKADLVLVMDGGRIVESGRHDELLANRSLYWALFTGEGGVRA